MKNRGIECLKILFFMVLLTLLLLPPSEVVAQSCCKICRNSQPCGNSCISKSKTCHKAPGCACGPGGSGGMGLLSAPKIEAPPQSAPERKVSVVDGDTIILDDVTIRLEGIDAPEMDQQCTNAYDEPFACGREAKAALQRMMIVGISCEPTGIDKYGRTLAYCTTNGTDINQAMVLAGWAWAFVKYNDRYVGDETLAREAGIGIWEGKAQAPWEWRQSKLEANAPSGECVIKGNISKGRKVYFMPFHLLYKNVKIDETKGEKWFCTEDEAMNAGWQRALR